MGSAVAAVDASGVASALGSGPSAVGDGVGDDERVVVGWGLVLLRDAVGVGEPPAVPGDGEAEAETDAEGIGLGVAWLVVVAAEMIALNSGLGYLIMDSRNAGNRYDLVIASMIIIGVIGLLLDGATRLLERLDCVKWRYVR